MNIKESHYLSNNSNQDIYVLFINIIFIYYYKIKRIFNFKIILKN